MRKVQHMSDPFSGIDFVRSAIFKVVRSYDLPPEDEGRLRKALLACDALLNGLNIPDLDSVESK